MSAGFQKVGSPINGRQNYYIADSKKIYTYSIPVRDCDRFEKYDKELTRTLDDLSNIDADALAENLHKSNINLKAGIAALAGCILGCAVPYYASVKLLKGAKKYIIGAITGVTAGVLTGFGAFIGTIGLLMEREALKTPQGQSLKEFLKIKSDFDMQLEKVENIK